MMQLFRGKVEREPKLATALLGRYTLLLLRECSGNSAAFLRESIRRARTNAELVRLRGAIFECMQRHLGEAEAMDRIWSFDRSA